MDIVLQPQYLQKRRALARQLHSPFCQDLQIYLCSFSEYLALASRLMQSSNYGERERVRLER